jgi:hypothetical protein
VLPYCRDTELITRLVEGYNSGEDLDKVAADNGICESYLLKLTRLDPRRITTEQRRDVRRRKRGTDLVKLYNAGYSIREIARAKKLSYGGVRHTLTILGVQLRRRGYSPKRAAKRDLPPHTL